MGEIAEMMLDGTLCEECGVYIDRPSDDFGLPRKCRDCSPKRKKRKNPAPASPTAGVGEVALGEEEGDD